MSPTNERRSEYMSIMEMLDGRLSKMSDTTYVLIKDIDTKLEEKFDKLEDKIEKMEENILEKVDLKIENKILTHQTTCPGKCAPVDEKSGVQKFFSGFMTELPTNLRYIFAVIAIVSAFMYQPNEKKDISTDWEKLKKIDSIVKMLEPHPNDCIKIKDIDN